MRGHSRLSSSRGRDETGQISERIPKKPKNDDCNINGGCRVNAVAYSKSDDENSNTSGTDDDDPLDAAKRAMMKFQEITGELSNYNFDSAASNGKDGHAIVTDHHPHNNNNTHDGPTSGQQNGNKGPVDGKSDDNAALKEKEGKKERQKKLKEEQEERERQQKEEARRKQRIAEGEARRRAFKPKIATAMDTLL
jgi:hypothetical protein